MPQPNLPDDFFTDPRYNTAQPGGNTCINIYIDAQTSFPVITTFLYCVMKYTTHGTLVDMIDAVRTVIRHNSVNSSINGAPRAISIPISELSFPVYNVLTDEKFIADGTSTTVIPVEAFCNLVYIPQIGYRFRPAHSDVQQFIGDSLFFPAFDEAFIFSAQDSGRSSVVDCSIINLPAVTVRTGVLERAPASMLHKLFYFYHHSRYSNDIELYAIPYLLLNCRHMDTRSYQPTDATIIAFNVSSDIINLDSRRALSVNELRPKNIDMTSKQHNAVPQLTTYFPKVCIEENGVQVAIPTISKETSLADHLAEQIRVRYGFFTRPRSGLSNIIIDSFYPRLVYHYRFDMALLQQKETLPATAVAISRLVADSLLVRPVPISQLIRVLGYTEKDITALLRAVKHKNLTMVFAGLGGTGMNTLYWLTELCALTNVVNLFCDVYAYEKETVEVSNMLRFPFGYSAYTQADFSKHSVYGSDALYKLDLARPMLDKLSRNIPVCQAKYITQGTLYGQADTWARFDSTAKKFTTPNNTFIYGAPGIEYRNELSAMGNFIAATHADNSCSLWLNPEQTTDIQIESYGMIQLGSFFMNQLRMAIGLLELLASDQNLNQQDHQVLNFSFDGTIQLPTDRQYNWQIDNNIRMATEEQAALQ